MGRTTFRALGITDEFTECECCGKSTLKKTVRLVELDEDGFPVSGEEMYFGVDCAARATGTTAYRVRGAASAADYLNKQAEDWARDALPHFTSATVDEYIEANRGFAGRPAAAEAALKATIAEARQILAGGGLVGTRFERNLRALPVMTMRKPATRKPAPSVAAVSAVSAVQGTLF